MQNMEGCPASQLNELVKPVACSVASLRFFLFLPKSVFCCYLGYQIFFQYKSMIFFFQESQIIKHNICAVHYSLTSGFCFAFYLATCYKVSNPEFSVGIHCIYTERSAAKATKFHVHQASCLAAILWWHYYLSNPVPLLYPQLHCPHRANQSDRLFPQPVSHSGRFQPILVIIATLRA